MITVYSIRNEVTKQQYIGKSTNFVRRKRRHFNDLESDKHSNRLLQKSFNAYGESVFIFTIEATFDDDTSAQNMERELIQERQTYIDNGGFNLSNGGEPCRSGYRMSDKFRENQRKNATGRVPSTTQRERARQTHLQSPLYEERVEQFRSNRSHSISDAGRKRIADCNRNKLVTESTRQKLREAQIGRRASDDTKKKMRDTWATKRKKIEN